MARSQLAEFGQSGMGSLGSLGSLGSEEVRQCIALATSEFTGTFLLALAAFVGTMAAELIRDRFRRRRESGRFPDRPAASSAGEGG